MNIQGESYEHIYLCGCPYIPSNEPLEYMHLCKLPLHYCDFLGCILVTFEMYFVSLYPIYRIFLAPWKIHLRNKKSFSLSTFIINILFHITLILQYNVRFYVSVSLGFWTKSVHFSGTLRIICVIYFR